MCHATAVAEDQIQAMEIKGGPTVWALELCPGEYLNRKLFKYSGSQVGR
jgi:hypothetical protein